MTGHEYLQNIKRELQAGRWQHKKGTSILAAFGYARRRKAALAAINKEMRKIGLKADPPIDENMPLDSSHVRFFLAEQTVIPRPKEQEIIQIAVEGESEESEKEPIPTFKVRDLKVLDRQHVECIKANETLRKAYTVMLKHNYSQLVVADTAQPLSTAIKGTITYQSIADVLIQGPAETVIDCLDKTTPQVSVDDDIDKVITYLADHDVVIVIGSDKHLKGIVTAWDLADEFADLVGPFKWIGEIECRVRECIRNRLSVTAIVPFLEGITEATLRNDPEMLTIGDLVRILQNPDNWEKLDLRVDRQVFSSVLDEVRGWRNRLMHFRDSLTEDEKSQLQNYCRMVRKAC